MRLTIVNRSRRAVPRDFLKAWVRRLSREAARYVDVERFRGRELVIVFMAAPEAAELNRSWRGKNYATDVLSFSPTRGSSPSQGEPESLGELVICPEVISRQAQEHGLLVRHELGYMVLHGFLHLLGYDHERSKREARKMFKIQDELFEILLQSDRIQSDRTRAPASSRASSRSGSRRSLSLRSKSHGLSKPHRE
jgi:probable rRNA maturation factor